MNLYPRSATWRAVAWAATGGACAVLAFLPAMTTASWLTDQASAGNPLRLAIAAGLWTVLGVGSVVVIGRLLSVVRPFDRGSAMLSGVGALAAAGAQAAIWASAEMRYGPYPEADYIGMSLFLAPAITALTGGVVASVVALGSARIIGASVAWLAIGAIGVILLDSSPGMADGISPSGWVAGSAFVIATAFAFGSAALLTRQRRLRPSA